MSDLKRQVANLEKRLQPPSMEHVPEGQRRHVHVATLPELRRLRELFALAQERQNAGKPSRHGSRCESQLRKGVPCVSHWLEEDELAEVNTIVGVWQKRARSTVDIDSDLIHAVHRELAKRVAHGEQARFQRGAIPKEARRVLELVERARQRRADGQQPSWWRPGLQLDDLDLLTD